MDDTSNSGKSPATPPASPVEWRLGEAPFLAVEVFGRIAPLELEVGFGKGRFLLRQAQARPDTDFVGVERAAKYFRLARTRGEKRGLTNLRLVRGDARVFVEDRLPDGSLHRAHVYFPDPWPKKRQHKRRLLDPPFFHALARKLRPGGELHLATDHADYFREIVLSVETEPRFVATDPLPEDPEGLTNYEVKYRAEGRPIHRARWIVAG